MRSVKLIGVECRVSTVYRPNPMGSSAMANSSVGALLPLRFFEYHKNVIDANAFTRNTSHAKYTAYPYLLMETIWMVNAQREKKRQPKNCLRIISTGWKQVIKIILFVFDDVENDSQHQKAYSRWNEKQMEQWWRKKNNEKIICDFKS